MDNHDRPDDSKQEPSRTRIGKRRSIGNGSAFQGRSKERSRRRYRRRSRWKTKASGKTKREKIASGETTRFNTVTSPGRRSSST